MVQAIGQLLDAHGSCLAACRTKSLCQLQLTCDAGERVYKRSLMGASGAPHLQALQRWKDALVQEAGHEQPDLLLALQLAACLCQNRHQIAGAAHTVLEVCCMCIDVGDCGFCALHGGVPLTTFVAFTLQKLKKGVYERLDSFRVDRLLVLRPSNCMLEL